MKYNEDKWIKLNIFTITGIVILIAGILLTMVIFGGIQFFNSIFGVPQFKEKVYNDFAVTLLEVDGDDIATYNAGRLAGPMLGAEESDNRLYDIYARKNEDGEIQLYIKNEKGCFIPISLMAVEYIRRH